MLEMNKVMLIGNLTRDPELSYLANGTALAKLGLAVNRRYKDRNGEYQEDTAFVDIDTWAKQAEFCSKYLQKGRRVYVEGRLKFDQWEAQDGSKRSKLGVTAERVTFADAKPTGDQQGGYGGPTTQGAQPPSGPAPAPPAGPSGAAGAPPPQQAPQAPPAAGGYPPAQDGPDETGGSTADDLPFQSGGTGLDEARAVEEHRRDRVSRAMNATDKENAAEW